MKYKDLGYTRFGIRAYLYRTIPENMLFRMSQYKILEQFCWYFQEHRCTESGCIPTIDPNFLQKITKLLNKNKIDDAIYTLCSGSFIFNKTLESGDYWYKRQYQKPILLNKQLFLDRILFNEHVRRVL